MYVCETVSGYFHIAEIDVADDSSVLKCDV